MSEIVPSTLGKPSSSSSLLARGPSKFRVATRATNLIIHINKNISCVFLLITMGMHA